MITTRVCTYIFSILLSKNLFYCINSDIIQRDIIRMITLLFQIILKYNMILHKMKKEINLYFIFHTFL